MFGLQDQGIGQDFALYYIAYATYLELKGNFAKAEAVYELGLEKMAYPVDRLRAKHSELQSRMVRPPSSFPPTHPGLPSTQFTACFRPNVVISMAD